MSITTQPRIHVSLATQDVARAVEFYSTLFGVEPEKRYDDYAKFAPASPALNLAINAVKSESSGTQRVLHMGIELPSADEVNALRARLESAGLKGIAEESAACCYAISDKFWVTDPDGNQWELFANSVTDTGTSGNGRLSAPTPAEMSTGASCSPASGCCAPAPTAAAETAAFKPLASVPADQGGSCCG